MSELYNKIGYALLIDFHLSFLLLSLIHHHLPPSPIPGFQQDKQSYPRRSQSKLSQAIVAGLSFLSFLLHLKLLMAMAY